MPYPVCTNTTRIGVGDLADARVVRGGAGTDRTRVGATLQYAARPRRPNRSRHDSSPVTLLLLHPTLFPYTTLFRSRRRQRRERDVRIDPRLRHVQPILMNIHRTAG